MTRRTRPPSPRCRWTNAALRGRVCRCRASGFRDDGQGQRMLCYTCGVEFEELYPEDMARLSQQVLYLATIQSSGSREAALVEN